MLISFCSALSWAQVPEDPIIGVQLGGGAALALGNLSEEEGATAFFDLQIEALFLRAKTLPLLGYVAFEGLSLSTTQSTDRFPFGKGQKVDVLAFLFIPTVCWQPGGHLLLCGGIGQGTVNVNGEGEERDYGSWNYQASLKVFPMEHVSLTLLTKYVGRVEQVVLGQYSYFTLLTAGLGLGWMW